MLFRSKYLMKLDAHSMVGEGYDEILQRDCEKDWMSVPSRYSLDAENWQIRTGKWRAVEYNYLTFPYLHDDQYGIGFHGKKLTGGDSPVVPTTTMPSVPSATCMIRHPWNLLPSSWSLSLWNRLNLSSYAMSRYGFR